MSHVKFLGAVLKEFSQNVFGLRNKCESTRQLDGQVVVITGANTGIGKETALQLSLRGAKIIIGCRDMSKANGAIDDIRAKNPKANIIAIKLDLSSLASVREFAKNVSQIESNIDILINNAGIGMCPEWQTKDGFEMQFGTNHLGHFLLTLSLLPLLQKSPKARVITVSSNTHKLAKIDFENINLRNGAYTTMKAYKQSKLSGVLFIRELAKRLGLSSTVTTYVLHPGTIKSDLSRNMESGKALYDLLTTLLYIKLDIGCQTTLYCALEESLDNESGFFYNNCLRDALWANGTDDKSAERLWNLSCDLVQLEDHLKLPSKVTNAWDNK
ncbi:unnamed protein product [Oppiella nova]|uniref:Uncharacterized protein n=1 Tax=Oppiella nova TaxID=334625 RepID=A0A7R9MGE9_9ACAR|nr:unnamed protein product [Oppiella nova]CAG2176732.1 unnamed protein product [Oppiella nova]